MRKRRLLWLSGLAAIPLAIWAYDRAVWVYWVGRSDLEVALVAVDESRRPINGAQFEVKVIGGGGFYEHAGEPQFVLTSGPDGVVRYECPESMSFGSRSGLGFTDTFAVHLPWWQVRASAPGYRASDWIAIDALENRRMAKRRSQGSSTLHVQVSLSKAR